MLNFTPQQMKALHLLNQREQLLTKLPDIKAWLIQQHNVEQALKGGIQQCEQLIQDAINDSCKYGYTQQTHIQRLVSLQCQYQSTLYNNAELTPLFQAHWITPEDRLQLIEHIYKTKQQTGNYHPDTQGNSLYHANDSTSLSWINSAIKHECSQHYAEADPRQHSLALLHHAQAYQLLKQNLGTATGWKAWQSDWGNSQLGIEQPQQQRRIQLQKQSNTKQDMNSQQEEASQIQAALDKTIDENNNEYPTLTITLPNKLEANHPAEIASLLHAWALQLYPIKKMQTLLDEEKDKQATESQGDIYA